MQQLVELLTRGSPPALPSTSSVPATSGGWSGLSFIYGCFPTAPAVPLWAMMYSAELKVISVAMIVVFLFSGIMTFITVALVVAPSDAHDGFVAPMCGGITICTASYVLIPAALAATRRLRAPFSAPMFWINHACVCAVLLGISWSGCEDHSEGFFSEWVTHEFFFFLMRMSLLASMYEVLVLSEARTADSVAPFKPNARHRLVSVMTIFALALLLIAVPAVVDDHGGDEGYLECVLLGANAHQRWISLAISFFMGLAAVYLIAALEREHARMPIPKALWWVSADDREDMETPQPSMSDKFKLELLLGLVIAECVLGVWEALEIYEVGAKPSPSMENLLYTTELVMRTLVVFMIWLLFGFGGSPASRFYNALYASVASKLSSAPKHGRSQDGNESGFRAVELQNVAGGNDGSASFGLNEVVNPALEVEEQD
jgi:hypothetical protein